jgi:EAL domain-containing protein (putative c-di-GMP-specific phosphodiesterase class I)/PAS domain-containing protein
VEWPITKDIRKKARAFEELSQMPGFFILVTNTMFELIYANDYFFRYFDCKPTDLIGKPLYGFLNDDASCCINEEHINKVKKEGCVWGYNAITAKPDGELVTINWSQTYIPDKKDPIILSFGLLQEQVKEKNTLPEDDPADTNRQPESIFPLTGYRQAAQAKYAGNLVSEQEIQTAIENNSFELYYQPIIHARTKKIIAAEALLRMNHPTRGRLLPAYVLPTAEKTGQIVAIGNFVIDAACKKIKDWADMGQDLMLSVNLSYRQFTNEELAETILRAVTLHDVTAGHLLLDITEDTISRDPEMAREIIGTLRQLGCKICLDDFGTGFSSLKGLEKMEIDTMKIDRSFLPHEGSSRKSYALVESLIMLAHGLGFAVTTSGVESEEQAETLLELSCDHVQGYLFSRPVSERNFDQLLLSMPEFYIRNVT